MQKFSAPSVAAKVPGTHSSQRSSFKVFLKRPAGHTVQLVEPGSINCSARLRVGALVDDENAARAGAGRERRKQRLKRARRRPR